MTKAFLKYFCAAVFVIQSLIGHANTLYLGSVGDDPDEEIREFNAIANYLQKHLASSGIDKVKTGVASNTKEMINLVSEQKVHLYIDSPFPSILVSQKTGSSIFLRRWKKGVVKYRSVIFTRKDSDIDSLENMKGKSMAFEDPFSTSSYFLPKATLKMHGLKLLEVEAGDAIPSDTVGYKFSDDDRNTMLWVLRNKVNLGAMNESSYFKLAKKRIKDLKVIENSIWVPRHVVSYGPNMSNEFIQSIKKVLTHMHESEEGKKALNLFSKTTRFDEFPNGAEKDMKPLLQLLNNQ